MRRAEDDTEAAGQDAFLDVVTNIVGILILLVMVVGLRASHAASTAGEVQEPQQLAPPPTSEDDVREAQLAAANAERDVRELIHRAVNARDEALHRERERAVLTTIMAEAEQELAARRATLSAEDQRDFDLRRKLTEAQLALDELTREQMSLLPHEADVEEIECQPTPLAKAVTGKEIHVLLADDHVAMVPFEELLELMKNDVGANIWRLRQQDEMDRTIGPVNGFRLRYWFVKSRVIAQGNGGSLVTGQIVRFSRCYFLPITTPAGEPAEEALRSGSEFHQSLRRLRSGTTITVWTYPGNYDRLREVKRAVRDLGFQVAVRPLPKGMPMGASASGSESVTE